MSAAKPLEERLIAKIRTLDAEMQARVLTFVENETERNFSLEPDFEMEESQGDEDFDCNAWLAEAKAIREQLAAKYGPDHFGSIADFIREMREERDEELLRHSGL